MKQNKIHLLVVFFFIIINGHIYFRDNLSFAMIVVLNIINLLIVSFYEIFMKKKNIQLNTKSIMICFILLICSLITCFIKGFNIEADVYLIYLFIYGFLFSTILDKKSFCRCFIKIMCIISFVSSILFVVYWIEPNVFNFFSKTLGRNNEIEYVNFIISIVVTSMDNFRNFGIFYEPGLFGSHLIFAILLMIIYGEFDFKQFIYLSFGIITSLSTTTYFSYLIILLYLLLSNNCVKNRVRLFKYTFASLILVVIFFCLNPQTYYFLVSKLYEISFDSELINSTGSGLDRFRSIIYGIELFLDNVFLGAGSIEYNKKFSTYIATFTPINFFCLYGIVFGSVINYYYFKLSSYNAKKNLRGIVLSAFLFIALLLNISSQNFVWFPLIYILIFYSTSKNKIEKN